MNEIDQNNSEAVQSIPASHGALLGVGLLVSAGGIAILLESSHSLGFTAGLALGQLLGSAAIAMPVFLFWRFVTRHGTTAPLSKAFNVFSVCVVTSWFVLFLVAKNLLPTFAPSSSTSRTTAQPQPTESPLVGLPVCKNYFDQFDNVPPKCKPK